MWCIFLWIGSIVQTVEGISGVGAIHDHLEAEGATRFPSVQSVSNIGITTNDTVSIFVWEGINPTSAHLWGMLPLLVISLGFAFLFFDRFSNKISSDTKMPSHLSITLTKITGLLGSMFAAFTKPHAFTRLLRLELKLMLKRQTHIWFFGLIILNICQLFISQKMVVTVFLPITLLWCVLVISPLGELEKQVNTS
jgi:hypothetical protein